MDTTRNIINIDVMVKQAWKFEGLPATRREVERRLVRARDRLVREFREMGRHAVCWGYLVRKSLQTPVGDLGLIVADGSPAIESAKAMVYPRAAFQLCLWHWWRTLKREVPAAMRRRFSRDFWEVYEGLDRREVIARARRFRRRWRKSSRPVASGFNERFSDTLAYLEYPERRRHRVRTVNLAEGFFRNFRRLFNRFPGFRDEAHLARVLGLYLLGAKPERWCQQRRAVAA